MNLFLVPKLQNDILVAQRLMMWLDPSICVVSVDFPFTFSFHQPLPKPKLCVWFWRAEHFFKQNTKNQNLSFSEITFKNPSYISYLSLCVYVCVYIYIYISRYIYIDIHKIRIDSFDSIHLHKTLFTSTACFFDQVNNDSSVSRETCCRAHSSL